MAEKKTAKKATKKVVKKTPVGDKKVDASVTLKKGSNNEVTIIDINDIPMVPKKTRGSKSASVEANCTATPNEIREIVQNSYKWFWYDIVKTDEECAERLNLFFTTISANNEIPTVEKMCLALGTIREVVLRWEKGELGETRRRMIKKAKELLASIDAELVSRGKIPQITYIFRSKNFFGMVDKVEYELKSDTLLGDKKDVNEIKNRMIEGTVVDE